jgi:hypothetical protein
MFVWLRQAFGRLRFCDYEARIIEMPVKLSTIGAIDMVQSYAEMGRQAGYPRNIRAVLWQGVLTGRYVVLSAQMCSAGLMYTDKQQG